MEDKLNILGFIPARAGSVGVPGKNRRLICGRPVIAYTIDAAQTAASLTRICVSSDDQEVLKHCRESSVECLDRPAELANATARIDDAIRHGIMALEADGPRIDLIVLLYANIPVRPEGVIDDAVALMLESGADSVHSVSDIGKFHPYWLFQKDTDGTVSKYIPNNIYRRQDLPKLFSIDGAVSVLRRDIVMAAAGSENPHAFWGSNIKSLTLSSHDTIDIDSMRDFLLAEAIIKDRQ